MKKLLIVVDYQKDFVDGALGFEGAAALDKVIAEKVRAYQEAGDDVVVTLDTHGDDYPYTQEGQRLPIAHCLRYTGGWRMYGETARLTEDCRAFEKPTFGSAGLFAYLCQYRYSSIELCGLVSNICVISNAVLAKTAQPDTEIIVDAAATGSADAELNLAALKVMAGLQISVLNMP